MLCVTAIVPHYFISPPPLFILASYHHSLSLVSPTIVPSFPFLVLLAPIPPLRHRSFFCPSSSSCLIVTCLASILPPPPQLHPASPSSHSSSSVTRILPHSSLASPLHCSSFLGPPGVRVSLREHGVCKEAGGEGCGVHRSRDTCHPRHG